MADFQPFVPLQVGQNCLLERIAKEKRRTRPEMDEGVERAFVDSHRVCTQVTSGVDIEDTPLQCRAFHRIVRRHGKQRNTTDMEGGEPWESSNQRGENTARDYVLVFHPIGNYGLGESV